MGGHFGCLHDQSPWWKTESWKAIQLELKPDKWSETLKIGIWFCDFFIFLFFLNKYVQGAEQLRSMEHLVWCHVRPFPLQIWETQAGYASITFFFRSCHCFHVMESQGLSCITCMWWESHLFRSPVWLYLVQDMVWLSVSVEGLQKPWFLREPTYRWWCKYKHSRTP